jgi:hypothetical protein
LFREFFLGSLARRCVSELIRAKLIKKARIGHELTKAGEEALKGD